MLALLPLLSTISVAMKRFLPNVDFLHQVEYLLLKKKEEIEKQLLKIEEDDPVLSLSLIAESPELGTESWQSEVHIRTMLFRDNLQKVQEQVELSLQRVKNGTYGSCLTCGDLIQSERLKVVPVATLCAACAIR
ncbi:TraR/DksA family transcriptional regulator [Candidatus Parcubacteria bacterium]|nr:MAG: TraR/DksA family transcriptional regulator [Candidatus Parcubacteria bacterium]